MPSARHAKNVTAVVAFAEVFWIRGPLTTAEQVEGIKSLFNYSWIVSAELDRVTAELARESMGEISGSEFRW